MKFKPVPEPPETLNFVAEVQRAVPLVPGSTEDCCSRIVSRTAVPARDEARTWLTFLQALCLAHETERGFARTRREVEREAVADAFAERVFGASEVLAILSGADEPLDADAVFESFRDEVPTWERHRNPDSWETIWRERVGRLLGWGELVGLVERVDGGYRIVEGREG